MAVAEEPVAGLLFHQNGRPADSISVITITTAFRSSLRFMNVGCVPVIFNGIMDSRRDGSILDVS